jgi:hypothetical protein
MSQENVEFFAEWIDAYEEWAQEVESIVDAGGSHVVETTRREGACAAASRRSKCTTASSIRWRRG